MMLDTLVSILPQKWQDKAKAIVVALGAVVGTLTLLWPNSPKWLTVAVLVTTVLGVFKVPNIGYSYEKPNPDA